MAENNRQTRFSKSFERLKRYVRGNTVIVPDGDRRLKLKSLPLTANYQDPLWNFSRNSVYNTRLFNQYYNNPESQRLFLFVDYNMMERDPIIARALSLLSEETCLPDENEQIIHIHTTDERIKLTLQHLFYEIMKVDYSLQSWIRQMLKYGDCFVYLNLKETLGIVDVVVLPSSDVERNEEEDKTTFKANGIFQDDIPEERMLHFRNIGNSDFLPYGMCLKYDTRVETEDGFKEIQNINIGDVVYNFDLETQTKVKSKVLDVVCSGKKEILKISTKNNFLETSKEHKIMFFNKETNEFDYKNAFEFSVGDLLVIDNQINKGEKIKIDKTIDSFNKNGFWNTLDNLPDFVDEEFSELFGFLIGDGWIDNNRVAFARGKDEQQNKKYEFLLEKYADKKVFYKIDERSTLNFSQASVGSKMLVTILKRMGFTNGAKNKRIPEWVFNSEKNIKEAFIRGLVNADGTKHTDKFNCTRYSIELCNYNLIYDLKTLLNSLNIKSGKICERTNRNGKIVDISGVKATQGISYTLNFFESNKNQKIKYDNNNRLSDKYIVEPISSIEILGQETVYDINVENDNHNFYANGIVVHNSHLEPIRRIWRMTTLMEDFMMTYYLLRSVNQRVFKVDVGNLGPKDIPAFINKLRDMYRREPIINKDTGEYNLFYDPMTLIEDFIIPVRDGIDNTGIDELPASPETSLQEGLNYLRQKMMAGLGVPNFLLNYEEQLNARATASAEDIRLAKLVESIQRIIVSELEKAALIHLALQGYPKESLFNFSLSLTSPSNLHEMEKLELMNTRLETAVSALESKFYSKKWIWRHILNLSQNEIEEMEAELLQDALDEKMTEDQISNFEFASDDSGSDMESPNNDTEKEMDSLLGGDDSDSGEGSRGGLTEPQTGKDDVQSSAPSMTAQEIAGGDTSPTNPSDERREADLNDRKPRD